MISVAIASALASSRSRAQTPPAATSTDPVQQARALYEQGVDEYNLAEYAKAVESFRAAYRIERAPELLFNIAQSYWHMGPSECGHALDFYKTYRQSIADPGRQRELDARVAEMEACVARNERSTSSAAAPGREQPSPLLPAALAAGGIVVAVVGGVLVGSVSAGLDCSPNCNPDDVSGLRARYWVGWAAIGVGATSIATGALVWLLQRKPAQSSSGVRVSAGAAGLVAAGRF